MIRVLFVLVLVVVFALAFMWYSSHSLPDWYQPEESQQDKVVEQLGEQINQQGVGNFLGSKVAGVMNGQLQLSEPEFNALLMASLQSDADGRRLLSISDALNAQIRHDELELGLVLDLDKAAQLDAEARDVINRVTDALPLLNQSKLFLAVTGKPVARDGGIALGEDFTVTIGMLPISSSLLSQLGVPVHKARNASLPLRYLRVQSISLEPGQINLGVLPRF